MRNETGSKLETGFLHLASLIRSYSAEASPAPGFKDPPHHHRKNAWNFWKITPCFRQTRFTCHRHHWFLAVEWSKDKTLNRFARTSGIVGDAASHKPPSRNPFPAPARRESFFFLSNTRTDLVQYHPSAVVLFVVSVSIVPTHSFLPAARHAQPREGDTRTHTHIHIHCSHISIPPSNNTRTAFWPLCLTHAFAIFLTPCSVLPLLFSSSSSSSLFQYERRYSSFSDVPSARQHILTPTRICARSYSQLEERRRTCHPGTAVHRRCLQSHRTRRS